MKTLFMGLISLVAIVIVSMEGKFGLYLQMHSIILVVGGSVALLLFITPPNVLVNMGKALKGLVKTDSKQEDIRSQLIALGKTKTANLKSDHPLISYAIELWSQGIDDNLFIVLISQKKNELVEEQVDAVQGLKNFSKYPPALGMTGTVMGMVSLFANLDSKAGNIGQSLAMAMTATFFGLILTNVLLQPLADRLHVRQVHLQRSLTSLYEVLLLINQGEPVSLIEDEVGKRVA